jgi:2-oxoglutarate ferredoxin oxidoreductase subunit alpha
MQQIEGSETDAKRKRPVQELETVVIRFSGDSGDGMQLTGGEFTKASALAGNDLSTFPDYPAEIRAPSGTVAGVSGFQVQFSSHRVYTPGDEPDVLVAMNPAALKANLADVKRGGTLILNESAFTPQNVTRAGYATNPIEDGSLDGYRAYVVPVSRLTQLALQDSGLSVKDVQRSTNMWALGLMFWMFGRPVEPEIAAIQKKFAKKPAIADANVKAFRAGYNYGETAELFDSSYTVPPARIRPGTYRNIVGNVATAIGMATAARLAGLKLFLGSYPITPASDILHELSHHKQHGIVTHQAEDEIAGICSAIGAAYGGALAMTNTSGPGMALKSEAMGLAVILELPLVIVNVQRGGPSTGLPTKTEQSDLMQALYGRHGEAPMPVIAARSPADCFDAAIEASRIAIKYMTPVILLTDGFIANGSEPWRLPDPGSLTPFPATFRKDPKDFAAYRRHEDTLARDWVIPGTPGLEHRIGGLEKHFLTGEVSYDPQNHEKMSHVRAAKIAKVANEIPPTHVEGPDGGLLLLSWGGTWGAVAQAQKQLAAKGQRVAHVHLRWMNPLPPDLGAVLRRFKKVAVCELNLGQLSKIIRSEFLLDVAQINKIQGKPFKVSDVVEGARPLAESL